MNLLEKKRVVHNLKGQKALLSQRDAVEIQELIFKVKADIKLLMMSDTKHSTNNSPTLKKSNTEEIGTGNKKFDDYRKINSSIYPSRGYNPPSKEKRTIDHSYFIGFHFQELFKELGLYNNESYS